MEGRTFVLIRTSLLPVGDIWIVLCAPKNLPIRFLLKQKCVH